MPLIKPTPAPAQTWERVLDRAEQLRTTAQDMKTALSSGPTSTTAAEHFERTLRAFRDQLAIYATVPNLNEYVLSLPDTDPGKDAVGDINAVIAEIDNTVTLVRNSFPADANGYLLAKKWGPSGMVDRTFSVNATAPIRAQIDTLLAAIG